MSNVEKNRRLWDEYARKWSRESVRLDSGRAQPIVPKKEQEAYVAAHINLLGDEWGRPSEVAQVIGEFIYPFIDAKSVVAEIGVGGGRIASKVAGRVRRFVAFDISTEMLKRAKKALRNHSNVEYVLLDEPVFDDRFHDTFDFVYSFDVFVHVDLHVMWRYFLEIGKLLKSGGKAFVHTANLLAPDGWARFAGQKKATVGGHYFVSPEIVHILASRGGFKIVKSSTPDPGNVYLNRDYLVVLQK